MVLATDAEENIGAMDAPYALLLLEPVFLKAGFTTVGISISTGVESSLRDAMPPLLRFAMKYPL
jgi:hypothetical protein